MTRRVLVGFLGAGTLMIAGCNKSTQSTEAESVKQTAQSPVQLVRNGVLANYNSTTIGRAFEGTFQDAEWTTFVSPKGATVVQFDGSILISVLQAANFRSKTCKTFDWDRSKDEPCETARTPITFQFTFSLDKTSVCAFVYRSESLCNR